MAAHTAKRQESVRLFSSVRVCMPKKRTAALFDGICLENIKLLFEYAQNTYCMAIFIKYTCQESIQSFILNAHAKKAYIFTYLIECAC